MVTHYSQEELNGLEATPRTAKQTVSLVSEEARTVGRLAYSLDFLVRRIEEGSPVEAAASLSRKLLNEIGFQDGRFPTAPTR